MSPKCHKYEIFRMDSKPEEVKKFIDTISLILVPFLDLLSTVFFVSFFPNHPYLGSLVKMN